jgi:hypothetical protein
LLFRKGGEKGEIFQEEQLCCIEDWSVFVADLIKWSVLLKNSYSKKKDKGRKLGMGRVKRETKIVPLFRSGEERGHSQLT